MRFICNIILVIVLSFVARGESDTLFLMHRLNLTDVDDNIKLDCIDSLLIYKNQGLDSLLVKKIGLAYNMGDYAKVSEGYESLMSDSSVRMSLSDELKLQLYYIHSLHGRNRFIDCINQCTDLLKKYKPDSLKYYDSFVDCVLVGFNKQTSISDTHKYIDRNEALLKKAQESGWPESTIANIKYACNTLHMHYAIDYGDFETALRYADYIVTHLNVSEHRRSGLSTNIAYIYMRLGKYDVAEECFKKLLEESAGSYNKAVSLLNYTHMLNLQGRYEETLNVLERYKGLEKFFEGDIYSSYLLGNKAIAESHVTDYEHAFRTLLKSKELGDSLAYNSGVQDGLLMLDYSILSDSMENLKSRMTSVKSCLIAAVIAVILTIIALCLLIVRLRRMNDENAKLKVSLKNTKENYDYIESAHAKLLQEESGKIAAQLLQVASAEENLERIENILNDKNTDESGKVHLIKDIVSSPDIKRGGKEMFERHFEQAHSTFFKNLYTSHPDLTPGEVRMCALIIMNMSNKEIASVTSKSIRSVESTRYRIGKKLEIPDGDTLVTYLRRFI